MAVHDNAFGMLRLLFAGLVIVSHSCEMLDGNRSREPLTRLFGAGVPSLGELSVLCFFLISGYLITDSYEKSRSVASYAVKRAGRILPGFAVAFVISATVVAVLGGADPGSLTAGGWRHLAGELVRMDVPTMQGAFAGAPYPSLNGSLWTIGYELRCYLFVIAFGVLGLHDRPFRYAVATALVACLAALFDAEWLRIPQGGVAAKLSWEIAKDPAWMLRFLAVFMTGALFRLYRDRISYTGSGAALAALVVALCYWTHLAPVVAIAGAGGYLIFWTAFAAPWPVLRRINRDRDLSYGIYLYGWPIGMLIAWYVPGISPLALMAATVVLVFPVALASWQLFEKPAQHWSHRIARRLPARARGPRMLNAIIYVPASY